MIDSSSLKYDCDRTFIAEIEDAIRGVLRETDLATEDRIKAIQAATQLISVKSKMKDADRKESFFGGRE